MLKQPRCRALVFPKHEWTAKMSLLPENKEMCNENIAH